MIDRNLQDRILDTRAIPKPPFNLKRRERPGLGGLSPWASEGDWGDPMVGGQPVGGCMS